MHIAAAGEEDARTLREVKRLSMKEPSGKCNVYSKITGSEGTSHQVPRRNRNGCAHSTLSNSLTLVQNRDQYSSLLKNLMANPAPREATYEDILLAPPNLVAEILNGRLHTHPRPSPRHAYATSSLDGRLFDPFGEGKGGPGGWWILVEPEVHLGPEVVVPDLAAWRKERLPELPDEAWIALYPDWVCEVLSPSTAQTDRSIKLPLYAAEGVPHCWLIDPAVRTLEAYELTNGKWTLLATLKEDDSVRLPPFDAIAFSLDALWP